MKKINKGEFGYIKNRQLLTVIRTVLLFALAVGIYVIGYISTGSNKNLLSIVAILGMLPASKSCVNMIMFLRFKSLPPKLYESFSELNAPFIYENVLTTTEKSYFLPVLLYKNHTIVSYCENKNVDALSIVEKHIKETMKIEKIEVTVKVFKDKEQFIERAKSLNSSMNDEEDMKVMENVYSTIKAVSL